MATRVATGLDRLAAGDPELMRLLRGKRVGLLAHAASVDARLRHALFVLRERGIEPVALFGPEHGFDAVAQDMIGVQDTVRVGGTPVYSLYGDSEAALSPTPAQLAGLDILVIDLQDIGSRYYTYVWTAVRALCVAAEVGVHTVVLDRPNPLGGDVVEGRPQRAGYLSFVGHRAVAVRHGMTIGELCAREVRTAGLPPEALTVVEMRGYRRSMGFRSTGLPWVMPSPNMPTLDTATVYAGGCLLEGTQLSEGRGTTRPFELFGAPGLDGAALAARVSAPGVTLRPLSFMPTFQKHGGQICGGVQVHVTEPSQVRSYALYLRLIAVCRALLGEHFAWRTEAYEFVVDRPAIDLLTGGPEYRELIDGGGDLEAYIAGDAQGAQAFAQSRAADLRYA